MVDHLHLPANPIYETPEIPYLVRKAPGAAYDGKDFSTFPKRQGLDEDLLLQGDGQGRTTEELDDFFQSWLFFGLLFEFFRILGEEVDYSDFIIVKRNTEPIITTLPLRERLVNIHDRFKDSSATPLSVIGSIFGYGWHGICRSLNALMNRATLFIRRLLCSYTPVSVVAAQDWKLNKEVCLAITMLGSSLSRAASSIPPKDYTVSLFDNLGRHGAFNKSGFLLGIFLLQAVQHDHIWGPADFIIEKLRELSWCKMEIKMISDLSDHGMYFISQLRKKEVRAGTNHSHCTETRCVANQVDEDTYQTKHRENCSGCKAIVWDTNTVASHILDGNIPVLIGRRHDKTRVSMEPSTGISYVAISHVWVQGLGNNKANSLPQCQLEYISGAVEKLFPPSSEYFAFWIDTLCIPTRHSQAPRTKAISRMKDVYRSAWRVLILDSELQEVPCPIQFSGNNIIDPSGWGLRELHTRILVSPWARRLWTLSEAMLANSLYIQFSDVAYPYTDEGQERRELMLRDWIYQHTEWIVTMFTAKITDTDSTQGFSQLGNLIGYRDTSLVTDESVCIAGILDLDIGSVLSCGDDPSQRMLNIFTQLTRVPLALLFMDGPKLNFDGYRWAPVSMLGFDILASTAQNFDMTNIVRSPEVGLYAGTMGFIVDMTGKRFTDTFYFGELWRFLFHPGIILGAFRLMTSNPVVSAMLSPLGIPNNVLETLYRMHYVGPEALADIDFKGKYLAFIPEPRFSRKRGDKPIKKAAVLTDLDFKWQRAGAGGRTELREAIEESGESPVSICSGRLVGFVEYNPTPVDEIAGLRERESASEEEPNFMRPTGLCLRWLVR